jgi:hypothetical protein
MELAKYIHGFQSNSKATLKDQEGRRVEQLLNCSFLKSTQFRKKIEYMADGLMGVGQVCWKGLIHQEHQ